jgi:hypothetical protein
MPSALLGWYPVLNSISEDEESEYKQDFDKDLAYAVHADPNAHLGNEAALQALFAEDTTGEGIHGNLAIPVENGMTEGADGRRNGPSAGNAGNNIDKRIHPLRITMPLVNRLDVALSDPLHGKTTSIPITQATSQVKTRCRTKIEEGKQRRHHLRPGCRDARNKGGHQSYRTFPHPPLSC